MVTKTTTVVRLLARSSSAAAAAAAPKTMSTTMKTMSTMMGTMTTMRSSDNSTSVSCSSSSFSPTTTTIATTRQYRGDSGVESQSNDLSRHEQELISIARPKADMIYRRHIELPREEEEGEEDGLTTRQKRLIYRSKQRGWLEVDLLLGTWASENVATLGPDDLDEFERFVNRETIDIYNVVTLRVDVPPEFASERANDGDTPTPSVVERIREWARSHPLGKADPQQYVKVKTEHNMI